MLKRVQHDELEMIEKLKKKWPFFLIFLLSWWAIKPLFQVGFFPMHDDEQIARLYELHQALSTGQFPPRWIANLGFGYGYPFYNFYPPFVYYFGEVFHLLGFSLISATKIVMILGFILSGFFMYLLAKEFFGKIGGIVAAIFYIYAPYHALDLYVRGALAEFYSFVFLPAIFWSTFKLVKEKSKKWLIINTVFLCFLLLSHNLITIIFLPFYFIYAIYLICLKKQKKQIFLMILTSFLLFLGLSCYFWLPAFFERKYTLVNEILTRELASYKLHFVYLRQLWQSTWGYGGSLFGLEDGISFEVGKPHLILSFLAGFLSLFLFWKKKKKNSFSILCFLFFVFSLFMISFHSQFIWDRLKLLWYLQFPWRFLVFAAFFSSFLSGALTGAVYERIKGRFLLRLIIASFIIFLPIFLHQNYFQPARYLDVVDQDYTNEEDLKWRVSKMSFEFVPKGVTTTFSDIATTQLDIEKEEIAKTPYEIINGEIKVIKIKDVPHQKFLKTKGKGSLRINVFNFPGWKAFIDKKETVIKESEKLKLITLRIPSGEHKIEVVFTDTPIRKLANFISLVSLITILIGGLNVKKIFA